MNKNKRNKTKKIYKKGGNLDNEIEIGWFSNNHGNNVNNAFNNILNENKIYVNKNITSEELYGVIKGIFRDKYRYSGSSYGVTIPIIILNIDEIYNKLPNVRNIKISELRSMINTFNGHITLDNNIYFIPNIPLRNDIPHHQVQNLTNFYWNATPLSLFTTLADRMGQGFLLTREIVDFDDKYPGFIDLNEIDNSFNLEARYSTIEQYSVVKEKENRNKRRRPMEEQRRRAMEEQRRKAMEEQRRKAMEEQRRKAMEEQTREKTETEETRSETERQNIISNCPSFNKEPIEVSTRKEYILQTRIFHPDKNPGCFENASKKFQKLGQLNATFSGLEKQFNPDKTWQKAGKKTKKTRKINKLKQLKYKTRK